MKYHAYMSTALMLTDCVLKPVHIFIYSFSQTVISKEINDAEHKLCMNLLLTIAKKMVACICRLYCDPLQKVDFICSKTVVRLIVFGASQIKYFIYQNVY